MKIWQLPFILVAIGTQLYAVPSLRNMCGEKGINLAVPNKSDIVAFNKDCTTAYVGPPSVGSAEVASYVPSANLSFCSSVKSLPSVVNRLIASYDYWLDQVDQAKTATEAVRKEHDDYQNQLIESEEHQHRLQDELTIHESELEELLTAIREAKDALQECQIMKTHEECHDLQMALADAKKIYISYKREHITARHEQLANVTQKANILRRKVDRLKMTVEEQTHTFESYRKRLQVLRNEAMESYAIFGNLEGMTAQILFESKWREQIEAVKQANSAVDIHITSLPITKSSLSVDLMHTKHRDLNVPATLIYASVPGFAASGMHRDVAPTGDTQITDLAASTHANNAMTSAVSGKIVLSLIGSCPFTDDNNKLERSISYNDLATYVSINTINEYPMALKRSHKVTFRASRFAEEIERRTEKGGFFRTETIHDIERTALSDDDFKIEFDTDPGMPSYTDQEKALLRQEAKREIIDRVLKEIGVAYQLASQKPPMPLESRRSGASVIAEDTECFGWVYCSVATFVVGVLDSIFGNADAVTTFKAKNDQRVTYTYSDVKPSTYAFTTTFAKRD